MLLPRTARTTDADRIQWKLALDPVPFFVGGWIERRPCSFSPATGTFPSLAGQRGPTCEITRAVSGEFLESIGGRDTGSRPAQIAPRSWTPLADATLHASPSPTATYRPIPPTRRVGRGLVPQSPDQHGWSDDPGRGRTRQSPADARGPHPDRRGGRRRRHTDHHGRCRADRARTNRLMAITLRPA